MALTYMIPFRQGISGFPSIATHTTVFVQRFLWRICEHGTVTCISRAVWVCFQSWSPCITTWISGWLRRDLVPRAVSPVSQWLWCGKASSHPCVCTHWTCHGSSRWRIRLHSQQRCECPFLGWIQAFCSTFWRRVVCMPNQCEPKVPCSCARACFD